MVVAEALAGIALVKSAVDGIKSAISTTNDVRLIAGHVDKLLQGRDEANKAKRDASNDPFSVKSIAEETINAKLAEEHLDEMRSLIDMRFGHGTWAGIINERARRIREAKEAEEQAKKEMMKKKLQFEETVETAVMAFIAIGFMVMALLTVIYFATRG
jgi:hypothetical protein